MENKKSESIEVNESMESSTNVSQKDMFTKEEKIKYLNSKYGRNKWRFMGKTEVVEMLKIDQDIRLSVKESKRKGKQEYSDEEDF